MNNVHTLKNFRNRVAAVLAVVAVAVLPSCSDWSATDGAAHVSPDERGAAPASWEGSEIEIETKNGELHLVPISLNHAPLQVRNLSAVDAVVGVPGETAGNGAVQFTPNWSASLSLAQGDSAYFTLSTSAQKPYFITFTPAYGDPDLYVYRWNGSAWVYHDSSINGTMRVDRLKVQYSSNAYFTVVMYGYTASGGTVSASWETSDYRLDLDVPYLNQNTLAGIGSSACSSASSSMDLATHGIIRIDEMTPAAHVIFEATASIELGLLGRDRLVNHLENEWGISEVEIDTSGWSQLYARIQSEIRAGRPLILGSKSMSTAGHLLVVRGFAGNNYSTARLIVNDPNGVWNGYNSWSTNLSGAAREYDYTDITSKPSDGVFVIIP